MSDSTRDDDTSHYEGALLEDILDTVKVIAEGQTTLWDKVDGLDKNVRELKEDLSQVKQDVSYLKVDVSDLKKNVSHLKKDVSYLKQDVSQLKDDMVVVKYAVTEQSTDLDNHEGRLKKLEQVAA